MASNASEEERGRSLTTLYLRGVPTDLVREAKAVAARRGTTLTSLVVEALSRSTGVPGGQGQELPEPLRADAAWYEQNKDKLLRRYSGQYLAILDQHVIDHDVDFGALANRVFSRVGVRPILMPKCLPADRVVRLPSPRTVRS
jgi:hypothetical protein